MKPPSRHDAEKYDAAMGASIGMLVEATLCFRDISRGMCRDDLNHEAKKLIMSWLSEVKTEMPVFHAPQARLRLLQKHAEWAAKTLSGVNVHTEVN